MSAQAYARLPNVSREAKLPREQCAGCDGPVGGIMKLVRCAAILSIAVMLALPATYGDDKKTTSVAGDDAKAAPTVATPTAAPAKIADAAPAGDAAVTTSPTPVTQPPAAPAPPPAVPDD